MQTSVIVLLYVVAILAFLVALVALQTWATHSKHARASAAVSAELKATTEKLAAIAGTVQQATGLLQLIVAQGKEYSTSHVAQTTQFLTQLEGMRNVVVGLQNVHELLTALKTRTNERTH